MLFRNESLFKLKDFSMRPYTIPKQQGTHLIPHLQLCSVIVLAAFAISAASLAHGQGAAPSAGGAIKKPPTQMAPMAAADAVPANKVTSQDLDAAFSRADVNPDGKLSRAEAEHFPAVAQRFEQIDGNHDRFISREEFNKAASN